MAPAGFWTMGLSYSIANERLYGTVNGKTINFRAYSGGGRGSTSGVERHDLKHWDEQKKAPQSYKVTTRGGPLPTGFYTASYYGHHKHLGDCAKLYPTVTALLYTDISGHPQFTERDNFYIHKRGPKGSDGCIVVHELSDLKYLLDQIRVAGEVIVEVHSSGVRWDEHKEVKNTA